MNVLEERMYDFFIDRSWMAGVTEQNVYNRIFRTVSVLQVFQQRDLGSEERCAEYDPEWELYMNSS